MACSSRGQSAYEGGSAGTVRQASLEPLLLPPLEVLPPLLLPPLPLLDPLLLLPELPLLDPLLLPVPELLPPPELPLEAPPPLDDPAGPGRCFSTPHAASRTIPHAATDHRRTRDRTIEPRFWRGPPQERGAEPRSRVTPRSWSLRPIPWSKRSFPG